MSGNISVFERKYVGIAQETARFSGDGADNAGYAASSAAGASVAATTGEQKTKWSRAAVTGASGAVETEADAGPDAATREATRAATSAAADAATSAAADAVTDAAVGAGGAVETAADAVAARQRKIKKEKTRLSKQFKGLEARSRAVADGLIEQAAFMRVQLQELAEDLTAHGVTELFSQGNQEPYERQRPSANVYASMNANYQKIIKQLNELLPKTATKTPVGDGFVDFINGREDL